MTLKIWGRTNSANVQKPLWVCDEMGVPYELEEVGGAFGRTKDPEYLAMNPNSRVPTIDDDGYVLWESNAIVRYLANKHGKGSMAPVDPRDHADADRWMDWQQTTVLPFMTPIFWGLVRTPEPDRNLAVIEVARNEGIAVWSILEERLEGRDYILGDRLTMADIPLGPQCHRWMTLITDRPAMPNLEAWYQRLLARPAFKKWCAVLPLT
jgi:glutathione S-transferase